MVLSPESWACLFPSGHPVGAFFFSIFTAFVDDFTFLLWCWRFWRVYCSAGWASLLLRSILFSSLRFFFFSLVERQGAMLSAARAHLLAEVQAPFSSPATSARP